MCDGESCVYTRHISPALHCACLLVMRLKLLCSRFCFHWTLALLIRLTATLLCLCLSLFVSPFLFCSTGETTSYRLFPRGQVNALGFTAVSMLEFVCGCVEWKGGWTLYVSFVVIFLSSCSFASLCPHQHCKYPAILRTREDCEGEVLHEHVVAAGEVCFVLAFVHLLFSLVLQHIHVVSSPACTIRR